MIRWWRAGDRAEEEEDRGRTLPGAAPVEFHRRWRQRESVTATERKTERQTEEEEEGGKEGEGKTHRKTDTHKDTLIEKDQQRQTQDRRGGVW